MIDLDDIDFSTTDLDLEHVVKRLSAHGLSVTVRHVGDGRIGVCADTYNDGEHCRHLVTMPDLPETDDEYARLAGALKDFMAENGIIVHGPH